MPGVLFTFLELSFIAPCIPENRSVNYFAPDGQDFPSLIDTFSGITKRYDNLYRHTKA
jgi:hypothetical protein